MAITLDAMSRVELMQLQKDIEIALKQATIRDREEARKAAEEAVAKFGYSLAEVTGGAANAKKTKSGKPAALPKYRNPENAEETWSGRGRKPHWFNRAIAAGVDLDTLEI